MRFWVDRDNGSQLPAGSRQTHPIDPVGNHRLRGSQVVDLPTIRAFRRVRDMWALRQGGGYLFERVSLNLYSCTVIRDVGADRMASSATKPAFSYDPAHLPVSPTRGPL